MTTPSDNDIAWAAGIFEGEGCLNIPTRNPYGVRLMVKMTDEDVIARWADIMGAQMLGPYQPPAKHPTYKLQWEARISRWKMVLEAIDLLYPWMCARRREKMDYARSIAPVHPYGTLICEDAVSAQGYDRHIRYGIPPCDVCLASRRKYFHLMEARVKARMAADPSIAERKREWNRVHQRKVRAGLSSDERERMLERQRISAKKRNARRSPETLERRRAYMRVYEKERRAKRRAAAEHPA
jgi:hypothetical protein